MSLSRVTGSVKPGPVRQCLGRWMEAGWRVRVVTRHARGVRGVATGLLTAYDRWELGPDPRFFNRTTC